MSMPTVTVNLYATFREKIGGQPSVTVSIDSGQTIEQLLEELQVPIDYIAGTSMGAIIGALYAAGYSADGIEALLEEADWQTALSDRPHRRDSTMRQKDLERRVLKACREVDAGVTEVRVVV